MKLIPITLLILTLNAFAKQAPNTSKTSTGVAPTGNTYSSGPTQRRGNVTGADQPISETSNSTSNQNGKNSKQTKSDKDFPIGPYKNGQYISPAGEEKQAEEALLQENQDETRINKMGPNKR